MSVFSHVNYKHFVQEWVANRPKGGRGEYRRLATHLGVSTTMVSLIFNGQKDLSLEMAAELSSYFSFSEKEERYFFLLVEHSRAGSNRLREKLNKQIHEAQQEAQKLITRVAQDKALSDEEKAIYYSSWTFTGLRNLVAIPHAWTEAQLAVQLQIPEYQVRQVLHFLVNKGLLKIKDGRYEVLAKATHIGADHPLVNKHHQNWRVRGFQKMDLHNSSHLFYTGPMSLSRSDADQVRVMLLELLEVINKLVVNSPSETVRCLNLDWFEY